MVTLQLKPYRSYILLAGLAFTGLFAGSFRPAMQTAELREYRLSGEAQGSTYHVTYYAGQQQVSQSSIDSVLKVIDSSMSIYMPGSLINRFNQSGKGCAIDAHLQNVVRRSLEIYQATNGVFDITVLPLVQAWGFGSRNVRALPDSAQIERLLSCISSSKLSLQDPYLYKSSPCTQIDVNGIAQGYSVDVIAGFLADHHITNFLVEIGGELRVSGQKPNGPFIIGIEGPAKVANAPGSIRKSFPIRNGAYTTSGNYRKYIESRGKRWSHLIDPKTGYPFSNELISVTVKARDAITADGFDNALMAMGLLQALDFTNQHAEIEAYFIYRNGEGGMSDTASNGFFTSE